MSRTIKVFSTETNESKEINTSATTWGQLKEDIKRAGLNADNMKGMVRETKNSLESSDSVLPTGNCTIFITPQKVKSGVRKSISREISDIRTAGSTKSIKVAAPKKKVAVKKTSKVAPKRKTSK